MFRDKVKWSDPATQKSRGLTIKSISSSSHNHRINNGSIRISVTWQYFGNYSQLIVIFGGGELQPQVPYC